MECKVIATLRGCGAAAAAAPQEGLRCTRPLRGGGAPRWILKVPSDWPIMPYSKVLTTWLEWPVLGWRRSYLQRTVNHWMVGGAWKQPADNLEFQWLFCGWFACCCTRSEAYSVYLATRSPPSLLFFQYSRKRRGEKKEEKTIKRSEQDEPRSAWSNSILIPLETVFGGSLLQSIGALFFRLTSHVRWNVFPKPLDLSHISIRESAPADGKKMFKFRGWLNCPSHSRGPAGLFTAELAVSRGPNDHSSQHSCQIVSCYMA